jgi:signal peptidase I
VTSLVRPALEAVFPRQAARAAARAGTICLTLAICVAALFPVSARAGTEVPAARWTTAGALLAAWAAFRWSRGRMPWVGAGLVALVTGAFAAPATWLLGLAGMAGAYVATAFVPRGAWAPDPRDREAPLESTQEILESVGMALVLALVVREFGFEAFKIPTDSMKPTILGDSSARGGKGDRLLAFKPVEYRRYDIVVFRFPLFRGTNYIKRLIGLPGEHVEIRDGDIYADGKIAPKPDDVQKVMWGQAWVDADAADDWAQEFDAGETGAWTYATGSASVDASSAGDGAPVQWAQLRRGFESDLRVTLDVEVRRAGGEFVVALDGGGRTCELHLTDTGCEVRDPGGTWKADVPGLADLGARFRVGFSMADRVVRVEIGDRVVASRQHADVKNGGLDHGRVRIGARGVSVAVHRLTVQDDLQYTENGGLTEWDVPADGYVMLGDNTHSSQDSREWKAYVVRTKSGRVFVAPERARLREEDRESQTTWFPQADGSVLFTDSYGVRRHVPAEDLDGTPRIERQPFAREADLVGRAFVIFFPFPPLGDFRPRLLR